MDLKPPSISTPNLPTPRRRVPREGRSTFPRGVRVAQRLAASCWLLALLTAVTLSGCGGDSAGDSEAASGRGSGGSGGPPASAAQGGRSGGPPPGVTSGRPSGRPGGPPGGFGSFGEPPSDRGVPVQVATVGRGSIAAFFETQGTLEAENEVDLVARAGGPIVELLAEEGQQVKAGQLLARIDDRELRAQLDVAEVRLDETRRAFERVEALFAQELVSHETLDQARASYNSAEGDFQRTKVQLDYTRITAPFSGQIVERYIRLAETVGVNAQLFRLSDFDPLLCKIQVPEAQLRALAVGQRAELTVEAWGDTRFDAQVLRVSPVVESGTGTVRVTLEVAAQGRLRPGMFASVFLEMERHSDTLIAPRDALALDSLGDSVFVVVDGVAERRTLELGLRNDDRLEVLAGLAEGEQVVVVGQDGLSEGTPVEPVGEPQGPMASTRSADGSENSTGQSAAPGAPGTSAERPGRPPGMGGPGGGGGRFGGPGGPGGPGGFDLDDPGMVERIKDRMRQRGLSDEQIEARLEQMRARQGSGEGGPPGGRRPVGGSDR